MTSRIVIVGQAPGRGGLAPLFPSASGRRLLELAGLDLPQFRERFDCVNLLTAYPGPSGSGRGDSFNAVLARESALRMAPELAGRRAIFLGNGVGRAFTRELKMRVRVPWCAWTAWRLGDAEFEGAVIPHPSGVSRVWNDEATTALVRDFLRAAARSVEVPT